MINSKAFFPILLEMIDCIFRAIFSFSFLTSLFIINFRDIFSLSFSASLVWAALLTHSTCWPYPFLSWPFFRSSNTHQRQIGYFILYRQRRRWTVVLNDHSLANSLTLIKNCGPHHVGCFVRGTKLHQLTCIIVWSLSFVVVWWMISDVIFLQNFYFLCHLSLLIYNLYLFHLTLSIKKSFAYTLMRAYLTLLIDASCRIIFFYCFLCGLALR